MLLSVIVPAYNVEKYLKKCVKSILTQKGIEYEVIIINDGSTDSTLSIAKEFEREYRNVRVIDQENKGLGGARNTGIQNALGKYIAFVDSDDYLYPNTYGILFNEINEKSFDIISFNFCKVYENQENMNKININLDKEVITGDNVKKYFYSNRLSSYVVDKIYDVDLFKNNGILFPEKKYYEDLRTEYEVIEHSSKVVKTNFCGYMYLQRGDSITKNVKNKNFEDFTSEYIKVLESIKKHDDDTNMEDEVITYKVLKHNALIRMRHRSEDLNYKIDERVKFKAPVNKLLKNKYLGINDKVINIIGESNFLFKLCRFLKK